MHYVLKHGLLNRSPWLNIFGMKRTYLKYTNFDHTNITVLNLWMKKICKFELVFNFQNVDFFFSVFLLHLSRYIESGICAIKFSLLFYGFLYCSVIAYITYIIHRYVVQNIRNISTKNAISALRIHVKSFKNISTGSGQKADIDTLDINLIDEVINQ